jgi:hypothetical protein
MANKTNEENWAARERLRAVEVMLWWRGWAGRADLVERFGLSPAQASSDFQKYLELNGARVFYQTSRKRYETSAGFECKLHAPDLGEAVKVFLGGEVPASMPAGAGGGEGSAKLAVLLLPKREAAVGIARQVFVALLAGWRLRVFYRSVNSNEAAWRYLRPGALAWDGRRWHVRAWCETREGWRDFVLGRMDQAEWPEEAAGLVPADADWEAWETLRLRINPKLGKEAKASLRMDYGMNGETMEIRVRRALKKYLLAELYIDHESHNALPRHFVMDGDRDG